MRQCRSHVPMYRTQAYSGPFPGPGPPIITPHLHLLNHLRAVSILPAHFAQHFQGSDTVFKPYVLLSRLRELNAPPGKSGQRCRQPPCGIGEETRHTGAYWGAATCPCRQGGSSPADLRLAAAGRAPLHGPDLAASRPGSSAGTGGVGSTALIRVVPSWH